MTKLALRNVSKVFGAHSAVDGFSLELAHGEFVSLLGPSGCGKTTTLRMIAGFIAPSEGTIEMDGNILSSPESSLPPERRRMSMIFQSYAIWPNMTVFENVAFGLQLRKLDKEEIRRRVDQVLDIVKMPALKERYPAELSGGQQQRVALARAIDIEPEVLLLDEPLFEIRRLHDELRITTVYVTHDQAEAMVTSDRIVVMNQGRIEQVDDPFTLYNRPKTRFVAGFIGRTNLLEGELQGSEIRFSGFSAPAALFPQARELGRKLAFSLRPQNIRLHRAAPAGGNGKWWIEGEVVERAYLGETWDYVVAPKGAAVQIRVSRPPSETYAKNDPVWLEVDPAHVAPIAS
jgi:iron(III) transport system ATP-binding protein